MATKRGDNSVRSAEKRLTHRFENVKKESERYILIWLDQNVNASKENLQTQEELKDITARLIIFEDISTWITSSISLAKRKVILLVSEFWSWQIIPVIHDFPQLTAIYVYSSVEIPATWTRNYRKCKGVFGKSDDVIRAILKYNRLLKHIEDDSVVLNVCDIRQSKIASALKDSKNATFMFFQVLIDILVQMASNRKSVARQDLIDHFKRIYEGDKPQLQEIKEFEEKYRRDSAVYWYTRSTFLYSTLNRALRDSDYEVLVALRFFINDLYAQLTSERSRAAVLSHGADPILRVYRGQTIATEEVEYMRGNIGQFVSFHSFLSTSLDRNVATLFFDSNDPIASEHVRILFEFTIDTRIKDTKPYADITRFSHYPEEKEVLLMLGCIFKIDRLEFNELEQRWTAVLSLCSEDNYELKDLMKQTKSDIGDDVTSLGYLLCRQGDYQHAESYFQQLLLEPSTKELDRGRCYFGLGATATAQGDYDQALEYHFKELEINEKRRDPIKIARTHMKMGETYWKKGDLDRALAYEEKARPILELHSDPQLSNVFLTMGSIYKNKNNIELAIYYYEKALQLDQQYLPAHHENFGIIYGNMGHTCNQCGNHQKALEYFHKAEEVLLKPLPARHPNLLEVQLYIRRTQAKIEQKSKP